MMFSLMAAITINGIVCLNSGDNIDWLDIYSGKQVVYRILAPPHAKAVQELADNPLIVPRYRALQSQDSHLKCSISIPAESE